MPPWLSQRKDSLCLAIKVQPRAARNEIVGPLGSELKIKVTAPPVDSAANEAVLQLLAEILDCPRQNLELVRGHTSTHKHVLIRRMDAAAVAARLGSA